MITAHSDRIFGRMTMIIDDYRKGQISLRYLVDTLEGSLKAIEEKLPDKFMEDWYEHWGNLEQWLALELEKERRTQILEEVGSLEALLLNHKKPLL